ncbi:MAG: rhodanese-like domain-containing protein [Saprospiraceae bacterium]
MLKSFIITGLFLNLVALSCAQQTEEAYSLAVAGLLPSNLEHINQLAEQPSEIVDFDAFVALAAEVQPYRKSRLVNLDRFLELAKQPNTIILDTRTQQFYNLKHVKGAKHLNFSDFTIANLAGVIPSPETTVLIYCNNNFKGDEMFFASKIAPPPGTARSGGTENKKPISLALNIPTFINLYGYGYRNVYELESMIHINDPRIEFEGEAVASGKKKG